MTLTKRLHLGWFTLAMLCLGSASVEAAPVSVLVEASPPFIINLQNQPSGPYIDAFRELTEGRGLKVQLQLMPARRSQVMAEQRAGTCILGITYSASVAEVLLFVGRVAPMPIYAFASTRQTSVRATSIGDLKTLRVGAIDTFEVRQLLKEADIPYETLPSSTQGLPMLAAGRFDVLVSDIGSELLAGKDPRPVRQLFTLGQFERWLACHPATDPADLAKMRQSLQSGVFAEATQPIWARYGMEDYYQQVRRSWQVMAKP